MRGRGAADAEQPASGSRPYLEHRRTQRGAKKPCAARSGHAILLYGLAQRSQRRAGDEVDSGLAAEGSEDDRPLRRCEQARHERRGVRRRVVLRRDFDVGRQRSLEHVAKLLESATKLFARGTWEREVAHRTNVQILGSRSHLSGIADLHDDRSSR